MKGGRVRRRQPAAVLQRLARIRRRSPKASDTGPTPQQLLLARWQNRRLGYTYADFLADPRYRPAALFFQSDLYGPRDLSRRDNELERALPILARTLPTGAIESLVLAVELHVLTRELDAAMLRVLSGELGAQEPLSAEIYAEAYRRCDNYAARARQIALIEELGQILDRVVAKPWIHVMVHLARGPAVIAGFAELQDFIERGIDAFGHMRGAEEFLATVAARETRVLDAIYAAEPVSAWADPAWESEPPEETTSR